MRPLRCGVSLHSFLDRGLRGWGGDFSQNRVQNPHFIRLIIHPNAGFRGLVFSFFLVYVSFAGRKQRLKSNPQHRLGEMLQFTKANKCPQAPKIRFDKMIVWKLPAAGAEIFRLWARFPAGNAISIKAGGGKMSKISSALSGRSHILPNSISHIAIATHAPPTIRGTAKPYFPQNFRAPSAREEPY